VPGAMVVVLVLTFLMAMVDCKVWWVGMGWVGGY